MSRAFALPLLLVSFAAFAQAPAVPPEQDQPLEGRRNQRIERLVHEDAGSRIEELRYAGQTQSITVQPKVAEVPAYDVMPATPSRDRIADERQGSSGGGQRFWNVFRF